VLINRPFFTDSANETNYNMLQSIFADNIRTTSENKSKIMDILQQIQIDLRGRSLVDDFRDTIQDLIKYVRSL